MSNARENMQQMKQFVAENMKQCCHELIEWQDTGVLSNGKVREASRMLVGIYRSDSLSIVESEIKSQALRKVANES